MVNLREDFRKLPSSVISSWNSIIWSSSHQSWYWIMHHFLAIYQIIQMNTHPRTSMCQGWNNGSKRGKIWVDIQISNLGSNFHHGETHALRPIAHSWISHMLTQGSPSFHSIEWVLRGEARIRRLAEISVALVLLADFFLPLHHWISKAFRMS